MCGLVTSLKMIQTPLEGCAELAGMQIAEVIALQSVFSEDGAVKMSPVEQSALESAIKVLHMLISRQE